MIRRHAGLAVAAIHLTIVGSLALKLVVDRARLPRAWARTAPFDPSTPIRGRYVSLALEVPLAQVPEGPADRARIGVRLRAVAGRVQGQADEAVRSPQVEWRAVAGGWMARLVEPVAFFIPEHGPDPSVRRPGEELWAEVTLPATGPLRPIRLGVMEHGRLTPLELR